MLYVDYTFQILSNGTIIFDRELDQIADSKDGDEYVLRQSEDNVWVLVRKAR